MRTLTLFLSAFLLLSAAASAQYCMLPGRTSYSQDQPGIGYFKLANVVRFSGNVENPLNQPSIVVVDDTIILQRGQTYTVTLSHTEDEQFFENVGNNIRVWIDYNQDFDHVDAGETVVAMNNMDPGSIDTADFTVPMTAPLGFTRLRATAKMGQSGGHSLPTPCDDPADPLDYHGEIEDYTVQIINPTSVKELNSIAGTILVYPNPTTGAINISLDETWKGGATISLYDITGKQVAMLKEKGRSTQTYTFNLNDHRIPQGVYFIRVDGERTAYQKVIRMNKD